MMATLRRLVPHSLQGLARDGLRLARRLPLMFARGASWRCPCCGYAGKFLTERQVYGDRIDAKCPSCGALERHRLQRLVLDEALAGRPAGGAVLHFAPEPIVAADLKRRFASYTGADLAPRGAQVGADMRRLQFADASFDMVYASHVLEHIDDDARALAEVRRVLRPGGIALLPVPMVAPRTVEYPEPVAVEHFHVRAPGPDYYERYRAYFDRVELRSSADYPAEYQLYVNEDRSGFPNRFGPYRPAMAGTRHPDVVPVCRVA